MKDTIQKLNDVLGHLTAMSFMRPETSEDLVKPLNDLSEAISEFENLGIPVVGNCTDCNAEINYKGLCEICHTEYMLKD